MRIHIRVFLVLFVALTVSDLAGFVFVFRNRDPLTDEQWSFLENQRPHSTESGMEINFAADGLNFALARRAVGGWEPAPARAFLLANLPGYFGAHLLFATLQAQPFGTSKLHSDLATAVFATTAVGQWALVAYLVSRRRNRADSGVV